ncbi:MAG: carboxylating nicotinate-nucleotide diphosphorylase [Bacteroidales bacterium]|jgi:nicotinate-nucleotide pyrophosphorylase (carboxylating)
MMESKELCDLIKQWLKEDVGDGDHTSLACILPDAKGKARLLIKEEGILAGVRIAEYIFKEADRSLRMETILCDGAEVQPDDVAFYIEGSQLSILKSERLVLNIMQRMSGIATSTKEYVSKIKGCRARILDTRKTAPGIRALEKEAVRLGGGLNHRMGLYDMIMLKDNHIDFAGGIRPAIEKSCAYIEKEGVDLRIEIEARNLHDVEEILSVGKVDRIMLDNFTTADTLIAVKMINRRFETESSGGITLENIRDYAECGVDFVSVGAITHHLKSLDMSLKAVSD